MHCRETIGNESITFGSGAVGVKETRRYNRWSTLSSVSESSTLQRTGDDSFRRRRALLPPWVGHDVVQHSVSSRLKCKCAREFANECLRRVSGVQAKPVAHVSDSSTVRPIDSAIVFFLVTSQSTIAFRVACFDCVNTLCFTGVENFRCVCLRR